MAEEIVKDQEEKVLDPEEQLKIALKEMVPKGELDEAKKDYNRLYQKILNGEFSGKEEPEKDTGKMIKENYEAAMKAMTSHSVRSACEHAKNLLAIDDYYVSQGQRSIFEASDGDRDYNGAKDSAEKTRQLIEFALEEANGDDNLYVARIANHLKDK